ncbi:DUF2730 domain-containing protein [Celeribacter baekdonensis]|uniref:DUF2730 domain-containing protein n=1 Tax=Celeribacter baekdonensis TaxID=875171 RepID=UPI0030D711FC|tara:strand:- start:22885 stop:23253 length:369 start_codon:yes stop_codon:yes gene_type:complete
MTVDVISILAAVLTLLSIANILYTWWRTRDKDVEKRDKAISEQFRLGGERMGLLEGRVTIVEQALRGQPTRENLHELHLSLKEMQGEMKTMVAVMEGNSKIMSRLETIVARHEDHLLDGGKR